MSSLIVRGVGSLSLVGALVCVASDADARNRVINGRPAAAADLRATVAFIDPSGELACTGTLVAPDVVMTAAHCVATMNEQDYTFEAFGEGYDFTISIGLLDATDIFSMPGEQFDGATLYPACDFLIDGGLGPGPNDMSSGFGRGDDIAFLKLATPVPEDVMRPIEIFPASRYGELVVGAPVTTTGYGVFDIDTFESGKLHTGTSTIFAMTEYELMTARDPRGQATDSCFGDSGGPLYYTDAAGETYVLAVTSRGPNDSQYYCGDGGIYTLAAPYEALLQGAIAGTEPERCRKMTSSLEADEFYDTLCEDLCLTGGSLVGHELCLACQGTEPVVCPEPEPAPVCPEPEPAPVCPEPEPVVCPEPEPVVCPEPEFEDRIDWTVTERTVQRQYEEIAILEAQVAALEAERDASGCSASGQRSPAPSGALATLFLGLFMLARRTGRRTL